MGLCQSLNRLPIWNLQNCSMFPLAFVAGWLQGHWWGFISWSYVVWPTFFLVNVFIALKGSGERSGSVVECRTPEREVRGSKPTAAVLCPWARHFTPRKYWLITQEAMAPSRHDWKIVDWDVKPQHNQPILKDLISDFYLMKFCLHSTCD